MSGLSFLTRPRVPGKTRRSWLARRAAALAVVAAVAVPLTGCDIVHVHFGSTATPGSATFQPTHAFVQCVHSQGVTDFPKASPGNSVTIRVTGNTPIARAYRACKHLL